jgi:hypothetical protein
VKIGRSTLTLLVILLLSSACTGTQGEGVPSRHSPTSTSSQDTPRSATSIRQTDAAGRSLPFRTQLPNRWSRLNNGTSYEPCTAVDSDVLAEHGLASDSVSDAATADFQTARGCTWTFSDDEFASLSQFVGNDNPLPAYKASRQAYTSFRPDQQIEGRSVLVSTNGASTCRTITQSQNALVFTSVMGSSKPIDELCNIAIEFTRATIKQVPN